MEILKQSIPDVLLIKPNVHSDERGFFLETLRETWISNLTDSKFIQHNQSRSKYGVLRGLHYQTKNTQGKLVRCSHGRVFDVAVDVRRNSPSFGNSVYAFLDDINHHQLWVPQGFAHGFLVLSDYADFCYLCTDYYNQESEKGINWNDPDLNIPWPKLKQGFNYLISEKDEKNILLKEMSEKNLLN
tara:strand:+ start:1504 stop:2061 length:558 start_codon:yes stop_codon:yes gene_type:complete